MAKQPEILGVIVNPQYNIVGLTVQLPGQEPMHQTISALQAMNFRNRQASFTASGWKLANRDTLWGLRVFQVDATGAIKPSPDNTMSLTARILDKEGDDAQVIGYYVRICGHEEPMKVEDIIRISGWVKPYNFVVRTDYPDGKRPRRYLAGKSNTARLGDLPAYVGAQSRGVKADSRRGEVPDAAAKAATKKVTAAVGGNLGNSGLDIETLCDLVAKYGGYIAMAPNEKYKPTEKGGKRAIRFEGIGASEIASPKLVYNETKLNANTRFRRRGQLILPNDAPLPTADVFMWVTKHLFYNGNNQMNEIRVLIPADGAKHLESLASKDFALRAIKPGEPSAKDSGYVGDPYNTQGMLEYAIRLNKLSIIGFPHPGNEAILNSEQLYSCVYNMLYIKAIRKVLNSKLSLLKKADPELKKREQAEKVWPVYGGLSEEQLAYLQSIGVNISDGSYNPVADDTEDKDGAESLGGATPVEIIYNLSGFNEKELSGEGKYKVDSQELGIIKDYIAQAAASIEASDDLFYQYKATKENIKYLDDQLDQVKHVLWRHKTAMVLKFKGKVHQHDKGEWTEAKTRKANAVAYKSETRTGLTMTLVGTNI